jgi:uncharacterized protein (TIGR03435 family)
MKFQIFAMWCAAAWGQGQVFDVCAVKPSAPGAQSGIIRVMPGNQAYMGRNVTLRIMMLVAYEVTDRQIAGGPDWTGTERFDLDCKSERSYSTHELHEMLARTLEERFQMKLRRSKREMPVWALVVDKGGPKLTPHPEGDLDHPPLTAGPNGRGAAGRNLSMDFLALNLSRILDRNVVDRTGISGYYDVVLDFVNDAPPAPDGVAHQPDTGPTVFQALREQLGLRLDPARAPMEYLTIESATRPLAN